MIDVSFKPYIVVTRAPLLQQYHERGMLVPLCGFSWLI